jgi:hypothetical protein
MGMKTCVAKWPPTWPNWRIGRGWAALSSDGGSGGSGGGGNDGNGRSVRADPGIAAVDLDSSMLDSDARCRFSACLSSAESLSPSLSS